MDVALVAIGRNEGERLRRCLESAIDEVSDVVYVDSGSSDGSSALATRIGARVVALDVTQPFSAARARNAGAVLAVEGKTHIRYVQFVDGDCELVSGWLTGARTFLESHPEVVAVCGRRRERFPTQSIYNGMCDLEWDTPVGEARAFGGDVMIRAEAFQAVGGYRSDLIAGEDPELAIRLRQAGGQVWRLDTEMTLHDVAMLRFSQWWRRSARGGYAFAMGAALHGATRERHWVRESRRAWLWGLVIPLLWAAAMVADRYAVAGAMLALYPFQWVRLALASKGPIRQRVTSATFLMLGKFAEVSGQLKFSWHRLTGRTGRLIEYK
jgi:glycosyltransferase involved in cell wall biosynthesis